MNKGQVGWSLFPRSWNWFVSSGQISTCFDIIFNNSCIIIINNNVNLINQIQTSSYNLTWICACFQWGSYVLHSVSAHLVVISCAKQDAAAGWVPLYKTHSSTVTIQLQYGFSHVSPQATIWNLPYPHLTTTTHTYTCVMHKCSKSKATSLRSYLECRQISIN